MDSFTMNILISSLASATVIAAFFVEINIRNGQIRSLENEKNRVCAEVDELRHEINELEDELTETKHRCKQLEEDMENDEHVMRAREELEAERKARREDQRRIEEVSHHKDEILVVVTVFGLVTLLIGAMISLVVILKSSGHIQ